MNDVRISSMPGATPNPTYGDSFLRLAKPRGGVPAALLELIGQGRDPASVDRQMRNLRYIAITRAMDHCNIFVWEGTTNEAVKDLVKAARFVAEEGRP
jgi:hypothetical protein